MRITRIRRNKVADKSVHSGGVGFAGLLTVLFVGLKLTGNINWSWWWVLSPVWITTIIVIVLLVIAFLVIVKLKD